VATEADKTLITATTLTTLLVVEVELEAAVLTQTQVVLVTAPLAVLEFLMTFSELDFSGAVVVEVRPSMPTAPQLTVEMVVSVVVVLVLVVVVVLLVVALR
jgi:hypothetical protein